MTSTELMKTIVNLLMILPILLNTAIVALCDTSLSWLINLMADFFDAETTNDGETTPKQWVNERYVREGRVAVRC